MFNEGLEILDISCKHPETILGSVWVFMASDDVTSKKVRVVLPFHGYFAHDHLWNNAKYMNIYNSALNYPGVFCDICYAL